MTEADQPSLAICTASGREPRWPYAFAMARMMGSVRSFKRATYQIELGYATDIARCRLVRMVRQEHYSHTLFVDDDMSFPADGAERLFAHGKHIIAANYTCRVFPVLPLSGHNGMRVFSKGKTGLQQVDYAPTGFMLIDNSVFDKLDMPWFQTTFQPHDPENWMSDDVWFCNKARAAGFEIWVDHDLSNEIGHVGTMEFNHFMTMPPPDPAEGNLVSLAKQCIDEVIG